MTKQLKSWAVIDRNGEQFISAKSIYFSATGNLASPGLSRPTGSSATSNLRRAWLLAKSEADHINDDEGIGTVTVELRPVNEVSE
jgi:hypothetical protein|tara:strand:- start:5917 stop:6171 length:255 start_codon:yes stop_codon:yes gene_type:complete